MQRRSDLVAAARGFIGTPWRHQGRLKGVGVDCVGLVVGALAEVGILVDGRTDYPRQPDPDELLGQLRTWCRRRPKARPGDILLFAMDGHRPQHIGIATDIGVIHAHAGARAVVEHGLDETWAPRVAGVFGVKGLR
ncbi:MAG: C40 family peptidase [Sandarakinorhabdus sp.]|nr:C40 family peptidase [Sandarakinorhabdus sp.]